MWAVKLRRIRQIITRTKYGEIIGPALIINLGTQLMDAVCRPHTHHNAHIFKHTNNGDVNDLFFLGAKIEVMGGSTYITILMLCYVSYADRYVGTMAMQKMVSTRTNPLSKLLEIFEVDPALVLRI